MNHRESITLIHCEPMTRVHHESITLVCCNSPNLLKLPKSSNVNCLRYLFLFTDLNSVTSLQDVNHIDTSEYLVQVYEVLTALAIAGEITPASYLLCN